MANKELTAVELPVPLRDSLPALLKEAVALKESQQIITQEGRALSTLIVRVLEALVHGVPKTEPPSRHHA